MVQIEKLIIPTKDNVQLEAEYYESTENSNSAVIICHPHPQFGGNMWNNVVTGVFKTLIGNNISCLRFNFRAVGNSTGDHSGGEDERIDVKACVDFLVNKKNVQQILISGYSYGSAIGASVINYSEKIIGYVAIAFVFDFMGRYFKEKAQSDKPKLFIQGVRDNVAVYRKFDKHFAFYNEPKKCEILDGADHFFRGHELEVGRLVLEFYKSIL